MWSVIIDLSVFYVITHFCNCNALSVSTSLPIVFEDFEHFTQMFHWTLFRPHMQICLQVEFPKKMRKIVICHVSISHWSIYGGVKITKQGKHKFIITSTDPAFVFHMWIKIFEIRNIINRWILIRKFDFKLMLCLFHWLFSQPMTPLHIIRLNSQFNKLSPCCNLNYAQLMHIDNKRCGTMSRMSLSLTRI